MYIYLLSGFKLISIVVYVMDIDSYNRCVTIIVAPMHNTSRKRNNISLLQAVNSLVFIFKLLALALTLSKLRLIKWLEMLLECRRASRESQPSETPTYNKAGLFQHQKLMASYVTFFTYKLLGSL